MICFLLGLLIVILSEKFDLATNSDILKYSGQINERMKVNGIVLSSITQKDSTET